jgi:hypothetical protein
MQIPRKRAVPYLGLDALSGICIHGVFFAMQQFGDLRDISHISGRHGRDEPARLGVGANMGVHPKEILVTIFVS